MDLNIATFYGVVHYFCFRMNDHTFESTHRFLCVETGYSLSLYIHTVKTFLLHFSGYI